MGGERSVERRVAAIVKDVEAADAEPLVVRHPLDHVLRLVLSRRRFPAKSSGRYDGQS
jgi:hypothetical protein